MTDLAAAWDLVHTPPRDAVDVARRSSAARVVATFAAQLPRITIPLVPPRSLAGLSEDRRAIWFNWEHLRVNVYHRVAPALLREVRAWREVRS